MNESRWQCERCGQWFLWGAGQGHPCITSGVLGRVQDIVNRWERGELNDTKAMHSVSVAMGGEKDYRPEDDPELVAKRAAAE